MRNSRSLMSVAFGKGIRCDVECRKLGDTEVHQVSLDNTMTAAEWQGHDGESMSDCNTSRLEMNPCATEYEFGRHLTFILQS